MNHPLAPIIPDPFAVDPMSDTDPFLELTPTNDDGSLHVVRSGSFPCLNCGVHHTNEHGYCSTACADRAAITKARIERLSFLACGGE